MAQLGRYEILQRLARGSVADVLLARASGLEGFARHVVIKQIRAEHAIDTRFVKAFLDEARIGASLNHHNIVQVFDIDQVGGSPFFAMEYVHGEDVRRLLAKVVSKGRQVPIEIVVAIGAAAAAGLHHAHEQNGPDRQPLDLVHRDVSPSNILIGFDGSVKLVDFGLAKPALSSAKTRGGALGKAPYMSPELCTGHPVDRRSDLFALGTVLYELATARRLFKGDNDYHTMSMIVEGTVPPPSTLRPELPKRLDEIIMRALAKSRDTRYQTAYDLRNDLESLAIEHELRTTAKAISDYLASVFGQRLEPWHVVGGAVAEDNDEVDFDAVHGIVPTPSAGLPIAPEPAESPIALAREVALGNTPDPDAFEDQATRLDITDDEEMATITSGKPQRPPATPSSVPTRLAPPIRPKHDDHETITTLGESTTTAAQPIVDVLTIKPDVLRTTPNPTVSESQDRESTTIDDAYSSRPSILTTPPGNPPLARRTTPVRGFTPSPAFSSNPQPPLAYAVQASPQSGSALQAGPHGAIVPVIAQVTGADTDAADEATTVEPPLFPMPGLEIDGPPPDAVYIPPPSHTGQLPMPMAKRWGLVAAVVLIPLVIGLIAHACQGDTKPPAVHGGP